MSWVPSVYWTNSWMSLATQLIFTQFQTLTLSLLSCTIKPTSDWTCKSTMPPICDQKHNFSQLGSGMIGNSLKSISYKRHQSAQLNWMYVCVLLAQLTQFPFCRPVAIVWAGTRSSCPREPPTWRPLCVWTFHCLCWWTWARGHHVFPPNCAPVWWPPPLPPEKKKVKQRW